ncbi:MAG: TatD family hydrolase [Verrucomicrobia bacterium]|nr:TatD family hydrolase [Verrucomicrobiota bacterium]
MTLVDTHAHLTDPRFRDDLDAVLERAAVAGVGAVISLATTLEDCEATLKLAERFPQVYAAVGVHPNHAAEAPADVTGALAEFARHPKVVAIGEAGMDYHYLPGKRAGGTEADDAAGKARQRELFVQQLELATKLGKPVVIHERECAEDLLELLTPYRGRLRGVFHCFGGPPEVARRVLDLGFHVSFTGMLTFKRAAALRELAAQLPPDRVMVETDSPYMAPEPHRGKRCEPAWVVESARALAAARGVALEVVAQETTENARRLFGTRFDSAADDDGLTRMPAISVPGNG